MLWWLSPGEGWDAFTYDAVVIHCEKGATTEYQGADVKIWAKGCMLMIVCVLSDLTRLPLLGGWRKSWYIITLLGVERLTVLRAISAC